MARMKIAIYDTDKLYRDRFTDYLMNYKSQEMELSVFSGISFLMDALDVDKYQLVVLGSGYEDALPRLRSHLVPVLVLTEYKGSVVRESVGMLEEKVSFTSRYQSMEALTRQMYLRAEMEREPAVMMQAAEVIGVFSPVHHEMQVPFSVLYASNLAQKHKTLYLNFMEFSGFSQIFGEKDYNLTDLVLEMQKSVSTESFSQAYIYEQDGLSYICPPKNPEDLKQISGSVLKKVIRYAGTNLGYELIIVDIGCVVEDFATLLDSCTTLYCIEKSGGMYQARQRECIEYLKTLMGEEFMKRVREVELPKVKIISIGGKMLLEQLNWSEFGDYVRLQTGGAGFVGG